ncbi:MAG: DUF2971 domain-containing protein [Gammaproteobacteria bacterium]|nr:DUF2971 domain-containing protein [Gammaproteobacteria bacterium]MCW8839858.1 DUF2971 domain-containing protein [Gammaproteobacteria bacterium]MCW8958983.1 DUF2971 domain-containing protein [Gammaproteobacteria bacterium]MCW8992920.1 DUF2971 domain-containing protein [Gammaproteobacteria bacterium]
MDFTALLTEILKGSLKQAPETVYHYTGAKGLIGLVDNGKIWATKIDYLNDPLEEIYGRDLVATILEEAARTTSDKEIQHFLNSVAFNIKERVMDCAANYFVASFSANPNDLVQWKMYADNGWGYSIGFHVGESGISREYLLPVIYEKEQQESLVRAIISQVLLAIDKEGQTPVTLNSAYYALVPAFKILIACMKQPEYSHEQEWRLVFEPNKDKLKSTLKFREGRNQTITPYVPLGISGDDGTLDRIPIERIILGPQRPDECESIRLILSMHDYPGAVPIEKSHIRYRG